MPILELGRVEAGEPLVEQQQLAARARARGRAPAASGRYRSARPAGTSARVAEADAVEQVASARSRAASPQSGSGAEGEAGDDVLDGRSWMSSTRTSWKVRAMPSRAMRLRRQRRRSAGRVKRISPLSGRERAGDQVEHRGLARAVRADQADDLAGARRVKRQLVDGDQAAEGLAQAVDLEHRRCRAGARGRASAGRRSGAGAPAVDQPDDAVGQEVDDDDEDRRRGRCVKWLGKLRREDLEQEHQRHHAEQRPAAACRRRRAAP